MLLLPFSKALPDFWSKTYSVIIMITDIAIIRDGRTFVNSFRRKRDFKESYIF